MADSSQKSSTDNSTPLAIWIVEIAVGYLTVIGFLFYPIGLMVLTLQLWNGYPYGLSDILFSVSLAPITLVAGKLWDLLLWAFAAMACSLAIGTLITRRSPVDEDIDRHIEDSMSEEEREKFRARQDQRSRSLKLNSIFIVVFVFTLPFFLQPPIVLASSKTWTLYALFVILTCIGGVVDGLIRRFDNTDMAPFSTTRKATAATYVFGILAGIVLAGAVNPSLPLVSFESATQKEGQLLAHTNGYWYVFDEQGTLVAIEDNEAGDVRFVRDGN